MAEFPSLHSEEDVDYELSPYVQVIQRCRTRLLAELNPVSLFQLPPKCLSREDLEKLNKKLSMEGEMRATCMLLEMIIRCKYFWADLMSVLRSDKVQQIHVADILENDLKTFTKEYPDLMKQFESMHNDMGNEAVETQPLNFKELAEKLSVSSVVIKNSVEFIDLTTSDSVIEPRKYQLELAKAAQSGLNCIICAPTGSGKTIVASLICQKHLQSVIPFQKSTFTTQISPAPKIVVLVPRFAVLMHVYKELKSTLALWKVGKRSGASKVKTPVKTMMEECSVIVVTADIFKNAIINGPEKCIDISDPTMLIFDECHHTMKDASYNKIMAEYLKYKFERPDVKLPQVIGLSASPGAGKKVSDEQARDKILTLCANLDAQVFCTVPEYHQIELEKHVATPTKHQYIVDNRSNDPFSSIVVQAMVTLEGMLGPQAGTVTPLRGTQEYESLVHGFYKQAKETGNYFVRKVAENLKCYSRALKAVNLTRLVDGLNLLQEFFSAYVERQGTYKYDDADVYLLQLYQNILPSLTSVCDMEECFPNPKLMQLKAALLGQSQYSAEKGEQFRAMVFVKTRDLTLTLKSWINDDPELCSLPADILTSINKPNEVGGMDPLEQNRILNHFKDGKLKILISTSVGEEGIDIPACNMCIRYNHVTNEIAMVQSRGRARKHESVEMVIGDTDTFERDCVNVLLEEKMMEAIQYVQLHMQELQPLIELKQKDIVFVRNKEAQAVAALHNLNSARSVEVHCKTCCPSVSLICHGCDVRLQGTGNRVVPDPQFTDRFIFKEHNQEKLRQLGTMMIFCKYCEYPLGMTVCTFPCLAIKGLTFVIDGARQSFKQWKKVPFKVEAISAEEMSLAVAPVSTF